MNLEFSGSPFSKRQKGGKWRTAGQRLFSLCRKTTWHLIDASYHCCTGIVVLTMSILQAVLLTTEPVSACCTKGTVGGRVELQLQWVNGITFLLWFTALGTWVLAPEPRTPRRMLAFFACSFTCGLIGTMIAVWAFMDAFGFVLK